MQNTNYEAGDIVNYDKKDYRVVENRIIHGKEKKKLLIALNVMSLVMIILVMVLYAVMSGFINNASTDTQEITWWLFGIIYFVSFVLFIIMHELIHGASYYIFGKVPLKNIKFGTALKSGMAYCISLVPNKVSTSRISLMMPIYLLVIPVFLAALFTQNTFVAFLSAIFFSGSAGDIWYMWSLRKDDKDKYIVETLPDADGYEIGYYLLEEKK